MSATVDQNTDNFDVTYAAGAWSIGQAGSTTTVVCPASVTYNGSAQTPCTASWSSTGTDGEGGALTPSYTNNTNFGTANASATFAGDANHTGSNDNKNFSINKAPVTATAGSGSGTYNFSTQSPGGCVVTGTYKGDLTCTNSPSSVGPGAGTTPITPITSGTGLSNFSITPVNGSYTINKASTAITFNGPPNNQDFACGLLGTYTATLKDTSNNVALPGIDLTLTIGTQSITGTTNASGLATFMIVLNQTPGSVTETVALTNAWADTNRYAPAPQSAPFTVLPDTNVGPGTGGTSLYTGPSFSWTTSPTSSTTTLTLNATVKDTSLACPGNITKATVSFWVSSNNGSSFTAVSNAQNLPVGLVNPGDTTVGTASTTSQYNIGSNLAITLIIRVVVGGEYALPGPNGNNADYDVPVVIAKPGQPNTLTAGGKLANTSTTGVTGTGFPVASQTYYANGYLGNGNGNTSGGLAAADVLFGGFVQCNNSKCTNPQGQLNAKIDSYNKPDGSVDTTVHHYFMKTNSISGWGTTASGSGFFSAKTNLFETTGGTNTGLDGGGMMQMIFANPGASYIYTSTLGTNPNRNVTLRCPTDAVNGCSSIIIYRSNSLGGGVWFSSAWGPVATGDLPQTIMKAMLTGGTIVYTSNSPYTSTLASSTSTTNVASVPTVTNAPSAPTLTNEAAATPATNVASATGPSSRGVTEKSYVSTLGGMFLGGHSNSRASEGSPANLVNPIARPLETRKSFVGRVKVNHDPSNPASSFMADGWLGKNWVSSLFDSTLEYIQAGTNPEGRVTVTIHSCNKPDGSVDKRCVAGKAATHHVYIIETNALSEASLIAGGATFASKTNVYEVMSNGTKVALDSEGSMQIMFIPKDQMIPVEMGAAGGTMCTDEGGCAAIAAQKSNGGVWYSAAWGLSSGAEGQTSAITTGLPADPAALTRDAKAEGGN